MVWDLMVAQAQLHEGILLAFHAFIGLPSFRPGFACMWHKLMLSLTGVTVGVHADQHPRSSWKGETLR